MYRSEVVTPLSSAHGAESAFLGAVSKVFRNIDVFLDFEVVGPGHAHVAKIDFVTDVDVKCVIIGTAG